MDISLNFSLIFSILGLHLLAVMSPGPDFILVTKNSLSSSRKAGVYTALGISLGLTLHIAYSLAGLGVLLIHSPSFFRALQIIGGSYLAYIGVMSLYSLIKHKHTKIAQESSDQGISNKKALRMGFFTNIFNPKVGLFFVSIFTQFFEQRETLGTKSVVAILLTLVTFIYFAIVSYAITSPKIKMLYLKVEHYIEFFFSIALLLLAGKVLLS